jgi:DNA-binding transcriptional LysR family regulator
VFDVFFPTAAISEAARAFAKRFPLTPLRIFVEGLGAGYQPVLEGRCTLGILASLPMDFPSLAVDRLGTVPLVMVAARGHPLANFEGHIPKKELSKHVQLVLTDRSQLLAGRDYGVLSSTTWRLADLSTKYALLKDCVGWGGMPLHMVEKDIASGDLVALDVDGVPRAGTMLTISAVYPAAAPPGPAGRWLVEHLKDWSSAKESPEPAKL